MAEFDEELRKKMWKTLRKVAGKDADTFRLDAAGALIEWTKYGEQSINGWQIDHACPKKILADNKVKEEDMDAIEDLRPFNTANNELKGDDFPKYTRAVYYDENKKENVEDKKSPYIVNRDVQKAIMKHYKLPIYLFGNGCATKQNEIQTFLDEK